MTNRLNDIRLELKEMAEREAYKVWRMKWRAISHGCSRELIDDMNREANDLYQNYTSHPEWLLDWEAKRKLKYAFCGERRIHTYWIINGNDEVVRIEHRRS